MSTIWTESDLKTILHPRCSAARHGAERRGLDDGKVLYGSQCNIQFHVVKLRLRQPSSCLVASQYYSCASPHSAATDGRTVKRGRRKTR
jgi:hypothetical protein